MGSYNYTQPLLDFLTHVQEPASVDDSFNDAMSDGTDSGLGSGWRILLSPKHMMSHMSSNATPT